jgi:hypothetical protein
MSAPISLIFCVWVIPAFFVFVSYRIYTGVIYKGNINVVTCEVGVEVADRRIFSRQVKFDLMYCISSQEADSNHKDTTKDINKIECVTCEVGVEEADKVAGEYSQGKLNLMSKH